MQSALSFVSLCFVARASSQTDADTVEHSREAGEREAVTNPVADPRAVATAGHARFTILTPELIRMEWAADGVFEDHASFVFLNRRLRVPAFTVSREGSGVTIKTSEVTLTYVPEADSKFTDTSLRVAFQLNGKEVVWHPGLKDTGNLMGTTRTLDRARGNDLMEPMEPGLISRDGWAIVDDSKRPLFDSSDFSFRQGEKSEWPWLMLRPAGDRQDLYFFGYGHDYKQALRDFVEVAGRIPLPPRFAFGTWWSRYWAYSDQELDEIVREFCENDVPLDTLVIDMDWHIGYDQLAAMHEKDQSGHGLGWSGYTWDKSLFPDPRPPRFRPSQLRCLPPLRPSRTEVSQATRSVSAHKAEPSPVPSRSR